MLKKNRLKKILFVMAILFVMIAAIFSWLSDRRAFQRKQCHANLRVLAAFIETYNRIHQEKMTVFYPESIEKLRVDFKSRIEDYSSHLSPVFGDVFVCPSNSENSYYSVGDLTRPEGIIMCSEHAAHEASPQTAEKY